MLVGQDGDFRRGVGGEAIAISEDVLRRARLAVAARVPREDVLEILESLGIGDPPKLRVVPAAS